MKITVLMEDTCGENGCCAEHGLSIFVETEKHRIIADTGASPLTLQNAQKLNIPVSSADTVFISHGHYDHTGGLMSLAGTGLDAVIYISPLAFGEFFHGEKYIGIDGGIKELAGLHLTAEEERADDELLIFSGIRGRRLWPKGNSELTERKNGTDLPDEFCHEQCLAVSENGKTLLISGCAHNGILNILDRYHEVTGAYPDAVISGFHMIKKSEYLPEDIENISETARELAKLPTVFFTGHCTGEEAYGIMKGIMGSSLRRIRSGDCFCLFNNFTERVIL